MKTLAEIVRTVCVWLAWFLATQTPQRSHCPGTQYWTEDGGPCYGYAWWPFDGSGKLRPTFEDRMFKY